METNEIFETENGYFITFNGDTNDDDEDTYKCNMCDYETHQMAKIKSHNNNVHQIGENSQCLTCKERITTKEELDRHIKLHKPVPNYKCLKCGKREKDKSSMARHTKKFH